MSKAVSKKQLFSSVKLLIDEAKKQVVRNVNSVMVFTYYHIGRMIVEDEQQGNKRAEYAKETIANLSNALTKEYGKGFSITNLEYFRKFYKAYTASIPQSVIEELKKKKSQKASAELQLKKYETLSRKFNNISDFADLFPLSWTHYVQLIKIDNKDERKFYEIETLQNNWSVRELQRQFHSSLYERLALSRDKKGVKKLAQKGQIIEQPIDVLKNPYILEFLDLKEDKRYNENDLETAIIDKLEHFMLELGNGFLFEGRQKRFSFEGDNYYIDLVFYNRLLKCFVLFDLKIGKLTHQDIGQMQMYVNYYDRKVKTNHENPTIGIVLCKEENKTVVEFTLPENNKQIFAKEYKLYLPSKEQLKKQLK